MATILPSELVEEVEELIPTILPSEEVLRLGLKLRVYTLHELVKIAEESEWRFISAYRDPATLTPYKPLLSGLNIVFKAI